MKRRQRSRRAPPEAAADADAHTIGLGWSLSEPSHPSAGVRKAAIQILSKSIYKELRENGYEPKQIVALATEIISLVTTDIGDRPLA